MSGKSGRMKFVNADEIKEAIVEAGQNSGCEWGKNWKLTGEQIRDVIDNAPTVDAVAVVRCKDCKFWDRTNMVTDIGFPDLARCLRGHEDYSDEFWFCADGERKEQNDE